MFRVNRDSAVEIELYRPAVAVNKWTPSPKKPPLKVNHHLFCGVCRCCGYIWQIFVKLCSLRHKTKSGNRLLNWPKLLGLYADGFSSICVPECIPYIIPHTFQLKKFIYSLKYIVF